MDIYREEILHLYKNPKHIGELENASAKSELKNPLCGDSITAYLTIENEKVKDVKFKSVGCMVSTVSADLLADFIIGKSVLEINKIAKDDMVKFFKGGLTSSRFLCANLALSALKKAYDNYKKV